MGEAEQVLAAAAEAGFEADLKSLENGGGKDPAVQGRVLARFIRLFLDFMAHKPVTQKDLEGNCALRHAQIAALGLSRQHPAVVIVLGMTAILAPVFTAAYTVLKLFGN